MNPNIGYSTPHCGLVLNPTCTNKTHRKKNPTKKIHPIKECIDTINRAAVSRNFVLNSRNTQRRLIENSTQTFSHSTISHWDTFSPDSFSLDNISLDNIPSDSISLQASHSRTVSHCDNFSLDAFSPYNFTCILQLFVTSLKTVSLPFCDNFSLISS